MFRFARGKNQPSLPWRTKRERMRGGQARDQGVSISTQYSGLTQPPKKPVLGTRQTLGRPNRAFRRGLRAGQFVQYQYMHVIDYWGTVTNITESFPNIPPFSKGDKSRSTFIYKFRKIFVACAFIEWHQQTLVQHTTQLPLCTSYCRSLPVC